MKSFKHRLTATFIGAALALAGVPAFAEDVDIFTAGATSGSKPNVLIVIDSSSNWSATLGANSCNSGNTADNTKFAAEVCGLQKVVDALPAEMRLGLMMFAETGTNGGYVRFGIRDLTAQNKQAYKDLLANLVPNASGTDNSGSNQPYAKTMFEAWKYFGGGGASGIQDATHYGPTAYAGGASNDPGSKRRDYNGNTSGGPSQATGNRAAAKYNADGNYALPNSTSNVYSNPINDNCAKNFVIFISNGNPGTGGDTGADTLFSNIGGDPNDRIKVGSTEVHASLMDEFARYFYNTDVSGNPGVQKLITYTIAVYQPQASGAILNTDQQMIKLMNSAATNGGGKPFTATTAQQIIDALLNILNEVQAVNSVFVSASLPVSVNTQGTFLNQVYMGLFRPESSGSARWTGNVKEYKFVKNAITGDLKLADSLGNLAVNPNTGFISPSAVSFWTSDTTFFSKNKQGIPPTASDKPDGDVVMKGGAAEVLRKSNLTTQANRKMYTCPTGTCPTSFGPTEEFKLPNVNFAAHGGLFNAASLGDFSLLVDWIRGEDNAINAVLAGPNYGMVPCDTASCPWDSAESGPGWNTTVRPGVHGDVLHSRPVVLNYTVNALNPTATGPHMIYAANDGVLRVTKGGTAATDGTEVWSFIAPEFYGKYRRLRYGLPELRTPGTPPALFGSTAPKDYFFDGPIGVYEDGDKKWIFVGARRGGAVIYAFDVSNPLAPKFKWKHNATTLPNLGQTWSLPIAFKISTKAFPYLVFGAGYDVGEDSTPIVNNGKGRGIYVLNADDGSVLRFIDNPTSGSITSPIASDMGFLAKFSSSGVGDYYRGYVGDLDGNVWRLDIGDVALPIAPGMPDPTNPSTWKLHKFASLGPGLGIKFLYSPDLVKAGDKNVVLIGSGDREKPLVQTSQDYFYGLMDKEVVTSGVLSGGLTVYPTITLGQLQLLAADSSAFDASLPANKGWYRQMAVGEKVVNSPLTVAGLTYFATNKPTPPVPGSCDSNLGEARQYAMGFLTGAAPPGKTLSTVLVGGGLAPSPVGGVVDLGKPDGSEGGETVAFCIGCDPTQRLDPKRPTINVPTNRQKIYWNTKTDG